MTEEGWGGSGRGGKRINAGREPVPDKKINLGIRLKTSLIKEIDAAAGKEKGARTIFVERAVVEHLSGSRGAMRAKQKTVVETYDKLNTKLQKQILEDDKIISTLRARVADLETDIELMGRAVNHKS